MTTLIVKLPPDPRDASALYEHVVQQDGRNVDGHARAPVGLLPLAERTDVEVIAIVPVRRLSWHQVQLPHGTLKRGFLHETDAPRLRAVLEGLLEEQLLDEPARLHFALQPQPRTDVPVWVAVCDRDWLQAGLHALELAGHPVHRIVPEFAPDALADTLHVIGEPDDARVVFPAGGGLNVWPLTPATAARLQWPATSRLVAEPAVAQLAEQLFQRSVTLQPASECCRQATESPWDLAQFDLASSSGRRTWKRLSDLLSGWARAPRWRAARIALLALLAVNLAGLNVWAWREEAQLRAKQTAVREILTSTFPGIRVVVDAPVQMSREVAALQRASGTASGGDLETMLGLFGAVAPVVHPPDVIDFVPGEIRMKGYALGSEEVAQIAFKLRPLGYGVSAESNFIIMKQVTTP